MFMGVFTVLHSFSAYHF